MTASKSLSKLVYLGFVPILVIAVVFGIYLSNALATVSTAPTSQSNSNSSSEISGVVSGTVTVGPSQPVCQANQSCTVNLSGYSLVFVSQCSNGSAYCHPQTIMAQIYPSGHYSILLPSGDYVVNGLSPSCNWTGCAVVFPKSITVQGGMQLVIDFSVDTGIR